LVGSAKAADKAYQVLDERLPEGRKLAVESRLYHVADLPLGLRHQNLKGKFRYLRAVFLHEQEIPHLRTVAVGQ
jgi:hypothetical protein